MRSDTAGHVVIEPVHDYVFGDICEEIACIQHGESFGFTDCKNGNIISPVFNYVYEFSEGVAAVRLTEAQLREPNLIPIGSV